MSRSRKKTPVGGVCCDLSEKQNKRDANRALRRRVHAMDLTGDRPIPLLREVSDVWCMIKDGRCYWGDALGPWLMRKYYLRLWTSCIYCRNKITLGASPVPIIVMHSP